MTTQGMQQYNPDKLRPKEYTDEHHPSSDQYMRGLRETQQAIVNQSLTMKKAEVMAAKLYHRGMNFTEIALDIGKSAPWVSKIVKTSPCQRLIGLLAYYQEAIDGPIEAQRKAMLWRISQNTEAKQPKVAISALAELNKMDNIGKEALANTTSGDINITINQQLSRTSLDD